ncbi:MAG TPA: hypothetical protein VFT42_11560 [Solirubrobacteraceae bacterium]|nr:hypothetical protein [Solirubrobacteraceae bacterium]
MTSTVHTRMDPAGVMPEVRVSCSVCGAHVLAWRLYSLSGHCSNCGSYEVRPLPLPERRP